MKNSIQISLAVLMSLLLAACSKDSNNTNTITASDFSISIDENPQNGDMIGTISASSSAGSLQFAITSQNPSGAIAIDSGMGELTVADASKWDYETNPEITATIRISNDNDSVNVALIITLNDTLEKIICEGDVILATQEEVISFGAMGCAIITGDLYVGGSGSDISDLSPLNHIEVIEGGLLIQNNNSLIDLNSFNALTHLGEGLNIDSNGSLERIEGFSNLSFSSGAFSLDNNDSLATIDGFEVLTSIYRLDIEYNPSLLYIGGFESLTNVETFFIIDANSSLIEINGFNHIATVEYLLISGNPQLTNFDSMSSLGPSLVQATVVSNASLTSLLGLSGVTTAEDGILIINNDALLNLDDLTNLSFADYIRVSDNAQLENLDGLSQLEGDVLTILISDNATLTSIEGLLGITGINDYVSVKNNGMLTTLNGLDNIDVIADYLSIRENNSLEDLCALQSLFLNDGLGGALEIVSNAYNPTEQDIINGDCSL